MENLQKLQELIEACTMRANIYSHDLFTTSEHTQKYHKSLNQTINKLTKELSILSVYKKDFSSEKLGVHIYEKNIFDGFNVPADSLMNENFIHYSKDLTIELLDGKILQQVQLIYVEDIEEHKKTQTI